MQAMMLHLANPAGLSPAQIEMVDTWLDSWAKSLVIEADFRPQRQMYAVNLDDRKPARKLRRNMLGEKYRYWGIEPMLVAINKIVEQLKQGELPARLKLGEAFRLPAGLELIEEVTQRWLGLSTTRKHERVLAEKSLLVMTDFVDIVAYLQGGRQGIKKTGMAATYNMAENNTTRIAANPEPSGEPELFEPDAQQWHVENESLSGYGVTFTRNTASQLRIGTLVGLKAQGKSYTIRLQPALERGGDYVQTGFDVVAKG
jgi:hypothetical protein